MRPNTTLLLRLGGIMRRLENARPHRFQGTGPPRSGLKIFCLLFPWRSF